MLMKFSQKPEGNHKADTEAHTSSKDNTTGQSTQALTLDGLHTPVMTTDQTLSITYLNRAAASLLENSQISESASSLIGESIDQFHDNPAQLRQMTQDPANLPWKTDIIVAEKNFTLTFSPQIDSDGAFIGTIVEWLDVTEALEQERQNFYYRSQIDAIGRSQAVIEFDTSFTILEANENFLNAMGYRREEIIGKNHSMFVDSAYRSSEDYKDFKQILLTGKHHAGEFKRISKGGREIWIQATYNPILDEAGNVKSIIKFASDITDTVVARIEGERVGKLVDSNLEQIVSAVANANAQTSHAANASSQTLQTVESVAASTDEFQSAAQEIAHSMEMSRGEVAKAIGEAQTAADSTNKLSSAAQSMNNIVVVIQDIAAQINLLALNATIESARAGEAGRGFAVVASEVKSLANQVGKATEQIANEIGGMQNISDDVVECLSSIKGAVESVEASVTSVASAVEEQVATTREISSSIQAANNAVGDVNGSLETINSAIENADKLAREGTELYRSLKK